LGLLSDVNVVPGPRRSVRLLGYRAEEAGEQDQRGQCQASAPSSVQRAASAQGMPTWTDVTLIHRDLFLGWLFRASRLAEFRRTAHSRRYE
jgi:hypothetical protein